VSSLCWTWRARVSIPSSSGQVFIPARPGPVSRLHCLGLNPFFIRSSIHPDTTVKALPGALSLNPFFIRSSIHPALVAVPTCCSVVERLNPFFIRSSIHPGARAQLGPDITWIGLNPFFIRSSIHPDGCYDSSYVHCSSSQSLLHQVKYSSQLGPQIAWVSRPQVSIPSSSGQVFIRRSRGVRRLARARAASQSLLHQVKYSSLAKA